MPIEITNVLGESLPVTRYYPDGSYVCPHCSYSVLDDDLADHNPACFANPGMSTVEAQRRRDREAEMLRDEEWNKTQREERTARLIAVQEVGYCLRCFINSSGRTKVRHRKPWPHA